MKPLILQSHGADVDSKSPDRKSSIEEHRKRDRKNDASGWGPKNRPYAPKHTTNEINAQQNNDQDNETQTQTKRVSKERKKSNKKIIHSSQYTTTNNKRDTTIKNKEGYKTINAITINPDTLKNNDNIKEIANRMNKKLIHIACIQETHIRTNCEKWIDNYKLYNAAAEKIQHTNGNNNNTSYVGGVGIMIEENLVEHVISVKREGGRHIRVTLDNKSVAGSIPLTILCSYAPHSGHRKRERQTFWNTVTKWVEEIPQRHFLIWGIDANGQVKQNGEGDVIGPHTNQAANEDENGKALHKICADNNLRPMNTWRRGKKRKGEKGEGETDDDNTTWISPNGNIRRQIDFIIVRTRFQNTVNDCQRVAGWRGNYMQQRQHAVIRARIQMSWALKYLNEGRNNSTGGEGGDMIKYDKIALKNGKTDMIKWAENEGELTINESDMGKNEKIWGQLKTKLQKMITEKFPAKPKNDPKRKKNEEWARANEKNDLTHANQNTGRRQKEIEEIDRLDSSTRKKLTLLNTITAWRKIAELSKKGHVEWASARIIDISHANVGRKTRIGDYNDKIYDTNTGAWENHELWKMITNHVNKERKMELKRNIRDRNRERNAKIREKMRDCKTAKNIRNAWENRKLEEKMNTLNDAAENGNLKPAWEFLASIKNYKKIKKIQINNEDGTPTQDENTTFERWTQWTKNWAHKEKNIPKMRHIKNEIWDHPRLVCESEIEKNNPEIKKIRENSALFAYLEKHPQKTEHLTGNYTRNETGLAILELAKNKSHGTDGIPAEAYQACSKFVIGAITQIINNMNQGKKPPKDWLEGAVVYLYKNKGDAKECNNYRPICLIQIAYKIWAKIVTNRLSAILTLATSNNQFGYKRKSSTIDALHRIQDFLDNRKSNGLIVLLDLSKAFDTINRELLWAALYRKGLPIGLIKTLRIGHENTTLRVKINGDLGRNIENNTGVFQGSPLSALLFIIYLDDMMEDYEALNDLCDLKSRIEKREHNDENATNEQFRTLKKRRNAANEEENENGKTSHSGQMGRTHASENANDKHSTEEALAEVAWANAPQCRMQPNQGKNQSSARGSNEQPPDEQLKPQHTKCNGSGTLNPGIAGNRPNRPPRANAPQCRVEDVWAEDQKGWDEADHAKLTDRARVRDQNDDSTDDEGTPADTNRADAVIYADDTNLLVEDDNDDEVDRRLCNYQLSADKRDLNIQWAKTKIVASKKKLCLKNDDIKLIKIETKGEALGKQIHANGKPSQAVLHRIKKANMAWGMCNSFLRKRDVTKRIRLLMWNAVVRCTLTYGLTIEALGKNDKENLEKFTHKCIRSIDNDGKKYDEQNPHISRNARYRNCKQASTASWIDYLRIRHAINKNPELRNKENEDIRQKEGIKNWIEQTQKLIDALKILNNDSNLEKIHKETGQQCCPNRLETYDHKRNVLPLNRRDQLVPRARSQTSNNANRLPPPSQKLLKIISILDLLQANGNNSVKNETEKTVGNELTRTMENQKWPEKGDQKRHIISELLKIDSFDESIRKMDLQSKIKMTKTALKYPTSEEKTGEEAKCPTCKKTFYGVRALNTHRAENKLCKTDWENEKNAIRCCENENCNETFKNDRTLNAHQKYHCKHMHKDFRILKNGTYNRRYLTNTGDPIGSDTYANKGRVKFDSATNTWHCLECEHTAGLYNSRSVIMHSSKHKKKENQIVNNARNQGTHKYCDDEIENRFNLMNLNDDELGGFEDWVKLKNKNENKARNQPNEQKNPDETHENDKQSPQENEQQNDNNPADENDNGPIDPKTHHYEALKLMRYDNDDELWECCTQGCNKKSTSKNGMAIHVGKCHVKLGDPKVRKYCAYCPRHYSETMDILKHLRIIENTTKKNGWKNATCQHIHTQDNIHDRWRKLLDKNKN